MEAFRLVLNWVAKSPYINAADRQYLLEGTMRKFKDLSPVDPHRFDLREYFELDYILRWPTTGYAGKGEPPPEVEEAKATAKELEEDDE
jgi:hypothetical protein